MPIPTSGERQAPVSRRLLRDDVYDRMHAAIVDGTLAPGETLRDEELIAWLGVSRTPIREALLRLQEEGLVVASPNNSTKVAEVRPDGLDDAIEVAGALRRHALRSTLQSVPREQLELLSEPMAALRTAAQSGDHAAVALAAFAYLETFDRATGNPVLAETVRKMSAHMIRTLREDPHGRSVPEIHGHFEDLHGAIVERDLDGALESLQHIYRISGE
ncbi:GntR family transcriptional regulator [Serinibacter salmoneus]|uniref:GntR family transcriptional regulator n=1 Tax=Serinibacter salmoneus TaxID=556530 RepID=A0A2A9CYB7_9MICO|nr:GntR family transcriptional regulator [Serinibacter salmoneus]PFG18610.1 GntR family transcriptional regulator [Serinibacter salmoneus]